MENQMKCGLLLSLKEMSLRKVAVCLWSASDILAAISKFQYDLFETVESKKEWQETIEDKIKDKVLKLELPETLSKAIIDMVRPISLDVRRWKRIHESFLKNSHKGICLPDSAKLCWTSEGAVDYGRTAKELVSCNGLDVVQRYQIASYYCVEDYIPLLWEELTEDRKRYFCNDETFEFTFTTRCSLTLELPFCWPHILKGDFSELDSFLRGTPFYQFAFELSAIRGNKTAAEYFFQKLTDEEREASLMRTAHTFLGGTVRGAFLTERKSDLLRYLLSVMTPEQQMEIVRARPIKVLTCFLDWPWQEVFLENVGLIWTSLPPSTYGSLIWEIEKRFDDPYFPKLFKEFFKQSPPEFRNFFVIQRSEYENAPACRFLSKFIGLKDSESIVEMFTNMDAADRVKLVFNDDVFTLFFKSVLMERMPMVALCLREATLSEEDRKRLKEDFTRFLESKVSGLIVNRKFKGFFTLLDETDANADNVQKV